MLLNSLGVSGGPGFIGSDRIWVGPAIIWAGFGLGLRIYGPGLPIARLALQQGYDYLADPCRWFLSSNLANNFGFFISYRSILPSLLV